MEVWAVSLMTMLDGWWFGWINDTMPVEGRKYEYENVMMSDDYCTESR